MRRRHAADLTGAPSRARCARAVVLAVALLALPSGAAKAQTVDHPLEVACAPDSAAAVRTTRVQLAFEPTLGDSVRSRALLADVVRQWRTPPDLDVPPLTVWEPNNANWSFPPLTGRLEVIWDAAGAVLEVRHGPANAHQVTRPVILQALERARRAALAARRAATAPTDTGGTARRDAAGADRPAATGVRDTGEGSAPTAGALRDSATITLTARVRPVSDAVVVGAVDVAHLAPNSTAATISRPTPRYPPALIREGVEGYVDLAYIVRTDSSTTAIRVLASPHPALSEAAVASTAAARVAPATAGGCRVSSLVRQRVEFRLAD